VTQIGEAVAALEALLGISKKSPDCDYWKKNHKVDYSGPDSKYVSSTQIATRDVAFRLEAKLAARQIQITSIFTWGAIGAGVTAKQKSKAMRRFKNRAALWSGRYRMKVDDPVCGTKTLPIRFRLLWNPDDTPDAPPYRVNLSASYPRANVQGWNVNIGFKEDVKADKSWTLTHEYGHTVSLPDEYFYTAGVPATVTYKKADASTEVIALEPANDNIMKTYGNMKFKMRFFYFAAVEAQELIRKQAGRNVTCEIV
jgi:type VI secretion system secreted protein VgrG